MTIAQHQPHGSRFRGVSISSLGMVVFLVSALFVRQSTAAAEAIEPCVGSGGDFKPSTLKHGEKLRHFEFEYAGKAIKLKPGSNVRVWLPIPPTNQHQSVLIRTSQLPAKATTTRETQYENCMVYFETLAPANGEVRFSMTYDVTRAEVKALGRDGKELSAEERQLFLKPNRLVPTTGRPLDLLKGLATPDQPLELGKFLYERVDAHMKYDKSRLGYGNGDSVWACDSQFGNCTDFHSLFISLARAKGLPARFEIGFPIPEARGKGTIDGYHCWAFFHTDQHDWVPTDISEADKHPEMKDYYFGNLTENRVAFSVGRDVNLVPRQAGEPLNFFVYPYIEVDGQPLSKEHMEKAFKYSDSE
ncbi:MAG: transglutaminase domain-containing protein [Rhodopirellula sp.]|nr:transglutaminase domain-containing protein [Rhodopirellula sp.]